VKNWLDGGPLRPVTAHGHPRALAEPRASVCPELDCIRHLLPHHVIAGAEGRARSIGVSAERVLICADAITEEVYLTALAASLGTGYERFENIARADCPLDDNQLLQAAAAGLLPVRQGRDLVWIIAPRGLTARRLADPRRSQPEWLRSFRLTSSEELWRFVSRNRCFPMRRRSPTGGASRFLRWCCSPSSFSPLLRRR